MFAYASSICLDCWQNEDLIFPGSVPLSCSLRWDLCGTHFLDELSRAGLCGWVHSPAWPSRVGTGQDTVPDSSKAKSWCSAPMEIIHPGNTWQFKMVLNLIWKWKFHISRDSQCFGHVPKRQLSPCHWAGDPGQDLLDSQILQRSIFDSRRKLLPPPV